VCGFDVQAGFPGPKFKQLSWGEASVNPNQLTIESVQEILLKEKYVCDRALATVVYLSLVMGKPLLLEGEAGVGKTEIAKVLAKVLETKLIRLQCYEGLDANTALYEWNYPKQMLRIKLEEVEHGDKQKVETEIFSQDYLIKRPLLEAIQSNGANAPVLLIDEIDRADDDFEAFLLELLAEASVTIPEIGTIRATHPPIIVLTSNRTRDLHDAVKRRCLYHRIEYPSPQREVEIVRRRVKGASGTLAVQVANAVSRMRESDVQKPPGIAEAIDWLAALKLLGIEHLDAAAVDRTLGSVLKYDEDQEVIRAAGLDQLVRTRD
jgi:MoxR-like ATPase